MNKEQFDYLLTGGKPDLAVSDLADQTPRTLLYGYTVDRATWHFYLKNGLFHLLVYHGPAAGDVVTSWSGAEVMLDNDLVPNKRLYPEACDFDICLRLKQAGVHLSFTTWSDKERPRPFCAITADEIPGLAEC